MEINLEVTLCAVFGSVLHSLYEVPSELPVL